MFEVPLAMTIQRTCAMLGSLALASCVTMSPSVDGPSSGVAPADVMTVGAPPASDDDLAGSLGAVLRLNAPMRRFDGVRRRIDAGATGPHSIPGAGWTSGRVLDEDAIAPPRSSFLWPLPHRMFLHEVRVDDDLAPELGTIYVVDLSGPTVHFALARSDELVHVRTEWLLDDGQLVRPLEPFDARYGRRLGDHFGDVVWVRAALGGVDPVLRLHVLDVLGAELLSLAESRRTMSFTAADELWHAAHVAVRADPEVQRLARESVDDPIPWIADAARRAVGRSPGK